MDTLNTKIDVACTNCGSDNREVLFPAGVAQIHQIVRCTDCDLMYASPRLPTVTNADEWDKENVEDVAQNIPHRIEKEALQVRDHRSTKAFLAKHHPQGGKLLEVGSSFGFLLDYMKQDGWDVLGIEPDPRLAKHAREMNNIDVIAELAEDAGIEDNSMDAIIMLHVIEHVPDPIGLL